MDLNQKNFLILLLNLALISYMLAGLPKLFSILSPQLAHNFGLTAGQFDMILYNATFFSLFGKTFFSFLINSKKFEKYVSINWLFFSMIIFHSISMFLSTIPHLSIHILGRYTQGLWAGILTVLLEPIIFNCSDDKYRKKLLYLKYELIALLTPIAIFITTLSGQYWIVSIVTLALSSIIIAIGIFFCKSNDNYYVNHQNNLLKISGFFESLINPKVIVDNLILGATLAIFLVLIQNHFYHIALFENMKFLPIKGFLQGLPFTLSFIIANTPWRNFFKNNILYMVFINWLLWIVSGHWLPMALVVHGLYITYVIWMPDMLNNLLQLKPLHISHRSISTASQVIRSFSTLFICKLLGRFYTKNPLIKLSYMIALGVWVTINLFILKHHHGESRSSMVNLIIWLSSLIVCSLFIFYY
jgi:hypothetical protein